MESMECDDVSTPKTTLQAKTEIISDDFLILVDELNLWLDRFQYPKAVECIYNPTIYARYTFEMYVRKYCNTKKPIVYLIPTPQAFEMAQTGVPYGNVNVVRDWMGIEGPVEIPPIENPNRPIKGFKLKRENISAKRFWTLFKNLCGTPDKFFETSFVYNYLPQIWLKLRGDKVMTPEDFTVSEMENLSNFCDLTFSRVIQLYGVEKVIAVGKYCETRAQNTISKYLPSSSIQVIHMPDPSAKINWMDCDWYKIANHFMEDTSLLQYYKSDET